MSHPRSTTIVAPILLLSLLAATGCASSEFGGGGVYTHDPLGYQVSPATRGGPAGELLGPDWLLTNYMRARSGEPSGRKHGADWDQRIAVDADDDGDNDTTLTVPKYDLRFEHRRDDALVWIQSVPVNASEAQKSLTSIAADYANRLSGGVYSWDPSARDVVDKRFAARILSQEATMVGGKLAHRADIEVANVDELRLDPNARSRRVRILLVRQRRAYTAPAGPRRKPYALPAILILAYSSRPETYDAHVSTFDHLAERITFP